MEKGEILFLSQEDTIQAGVLDMAMVVPTMEEVFKLHHRNDYILPTKCVLRWGDADSESTRGRINAMPGWIGGPSPAVGIKWIASAPQNPFKYGLPRANALVILNDPETLAPVAVMDGTALSASRTGANTGVAAKYLARKDSKVLGLIGAGVQNYTQLLAVHHVLPGLETIRVYDIDQARAEAFARKAGGFIGKTVTAVASAKEAVEGADVYITATVTKEPIIKKDWVKPGVFYSHVGSHECEFEAILAFDKRVVDDWQAIRHRGVESLAIMFEEGLIDDRAIYAEIGQLVSGSKKGRESDRESIYLNTVGMGIEDVAVADKVYKKALEMGLGQKLKLWNEPFAV